MKIDVKSKNPVVISFSGFLDFESVSHFSSAISKLKLQSKVVFDFKDLEFVGSSGIKSFIDTLDGFYEKSEGNMSISGVGSDFKKIIDHYKCSESIEEN